MKKLKLYVWEGVLTDYTSGVMFALASHPDEARAMIMGLEYPDWEERKKSGNFYKGTVWNDLQDAPQVFDKPVGFAVWGGG